MRGPSAGLHEMKKIKICAAVMSWGKQMSDKTLSGRPVTASDQLHQDHVEEPIRGDFVEK